MLIFILLTHDFTKSSIISATKAYQLIVQSGGRPDFEFNLEYVGSIFELFSGDRLTIQYIPLVGSHLIENVLENQNNRIGVAA